MRINKFKIMNYKCFWETDYVHLFPGFNIVVGPNNIGKTALLESLSLHATSQPHRSVLRPKGTPLDRESHFFAETAIDPKELRNAAISNDVFHITIKQGIALPADPIHLIESSLFKDGITILSDFGNESRGPREALSPNFISFPGDGGNQHLSFKSDRRSNNFSVQSRGNNGANIVGLAHEIARNSVYMFKAERQGIAKTRVGPSRKLHPAALNLAEVLSNMQENPHLFNELNEYIHHIFPSIHRVITKNLDNQEVEVRIWLAPPETKRDDLSFPLSESGTGVGQILSILYVVMTSESPLTIIIDEPNSYLHPGAARKLIDIIKNYKSHQYIMSSHSTDVITSANPASIIKLNFDGQETKISIIDRENINDMQAVMIDIGFRLSDVFGADTIIWVEGETEEICFPLILKKMERDRGVTVRSVDTTGGILGKRKKAKIIIRIYEKLSTGVALVPAAIAFSFDREGLSTTEIDDIRRNRSDKVRFLPRVNYEAYLLHPGALASVLGKYHGALQNISSENIEGWLRNNAGQKCYLIGTSDQQYLSVNWINSVDGSKVIDGLVDAFFGETVEIRKPSLARDLTEWLLENDPRHIAELTTYFAALVP